jgi:hypothetical protein
MPGALSFDPGHAKHRSARRERRGALPDRVPGGPRGLRPARSRPPVHTMIASKVGCEPCQVACVVTRPGIDPFAGHVGAQDAAISRLACQGPSCAWPRLPGEGDRNSRRRSARHRGFPGGPPSLVRRASKLRCREVSLRCPSDEASMLTRHAMQPTREATKFGDPEYPCRSPKRSGSIRVVGRLDLTDIELGCSLSRAVS